MGSAQSTNLTNSVIGSYAKVLQDTTNSAMINSSNQAKIVVGGGTGDMTISNVVSKQSIVSNLVASFKTVNDSSVMQKVSQQLQQNASSLVSGLNFGNQSESDNTISTAINTSMDVSQTISTTCASVSSNDFLLDVSKQTGNVSIDNINIEQTIDSSLQCAATSMNKSIAAQSTENKVEQTASATTEGLSLNFGMIIAAVIIAVMFAGAMVLKNPAIIMFFMLIIIAVIDSKLFQNYGICETNVANINDTIKKNSAIPKPVKPSDQLNTFNYTCGLRGISKITADYTACFSPIFSTFPPIQSVSGCLYTEVPLPTSFTTPDDAYAYWMDRPELVGIDIISRGNNNYEYHFYSAVSKECITLMTTVASDPKRINVPPLICVMHDPINTLADLPVANVSDYDFVFTTNGILYYMENNKWVQVNNTSAFNTNNPDNIFLSMTPLVESSPEASSNLSGNYYFIDMSTARKTGSTSTDQKIFYYTIYSYNLGTPPPAGTSTNQKIALDPSSFVKVGKIDVSSLIATKNIGPFMANPLATSRRNVTVIWDKSSTEESVEDNNNALLVYWINQSKNYKNGSIFFNVIAVIIMIVVVLMSRKSPVPAPMYNIPKY